MATAAAYGSRSGAPATPAGFSRYMVDGRARELGLGARHSVNLAEARELARRSRQMLLDGVDPIEERKARIAAQKLEALRTTTFAQAAEQFLATDAVQRLANDRHRKQWRSTLEEACKTIGTLPLRADQLGAIMLKTLLPIWQRAPETGSRLRGRLERVFAWALAHKLYAGTNPAALDVLARCPAGQAKAEAPCGNALWRAAGLHGPTPRPR